MKSGIKYTLLSVDKKGRMHLPRELRENLGIADQVLVEKERGTLIVKPVKKIDDPVMFLSSLNVKTKKSPVEMKREAEAVF